MISCLVPLGDFPWLVIVPSHRDQHDKSHSSTLSNSVICGSRHQTQKVLSIVAKLNRLSSLQKIPTYWCSKFPYSSTHDSKVYCCHCLICDSLDITVVCLIRQCGLSYLSFHWYPPQYFLVLLMLFFHDRVETWRVSDTLSYHQFLSATDGSHIYCSSPNHVYRHKLLYAKS